MKSKLGFVLLPGAGMSDWVWIKLTPLLDTKAVTLSRRIDVNNRDQRLKSSFSDIVNYTNSIIEKSGFDEVIVAGHSGAGLLAGALGKANKKVKHVVFIAANIPKDGNTAIDVFPEEIRKKNIEAVKAQAENDTIPMKMLEQMFRTSFCNTTTEEDIAYILSQNYQPEPVCVLTEKMDWSSYPDIGKTYIICTRDKTLQERHQEILASNLKITDIRRIDSDHMVMISHPEELAFELNDILKLYL